MLLGKTELIGEANEPINVFDLPQLYTKPSRLALLEALASLKVKATSWDWSNADEGQPKEDRNAIASYLTKIISSSLTWLSEDEQVEVWEQASSRLSERSGRTGMPAQTRTFLIPTSPPTPLSLHEPTLTNDNLGLKTWGTALILAQHLLPLLPSHLPHLFPANRTPPSVLELGAGTGLLGLAAAALWGTEVTLTDLPAIVPNLTSNAAANEAVIGEHGGKASTEVLDWSLCVSPGRESDIIIAADPLYAPEHPGWLAQAVDSRLERAEGARAVIGYPRKPWEDPRDYGAFGPNAYEGDDGPERAQRNLQRFVEAHMVPMNPWPMGKNAKAIGDDQIIWWEEKDGKKLIQPGNIEIVSIASTVANGQVWILKGVRNYA